MCTDLTPAQQQLATLMSQLSQRAYRAQWMLNIEVELWRAMNASDGGGAPHNLTLDDAAQLQTMAETCGGWIAHDHTSGLAFVPMEEWLARMGDGQRG